MKNLIFLFTFLFLFLNTQKVFCEDIQGKIKPNFIIKNSSAEFKIGETIPAIIEIWPINDSNFLFKKEEILDKRISKEFFVSQIKDIKRSENNPEVVQIFLDVTLASLAPTGNSMVEIGEYKLPLAIEGFKIIDDIKNPPKKIVFLKQKNYGIPLNYLLICFFVFLISFSLVVIFSIRRIRNKKIKKIKEEEILTRKKWKDKFEQAKSRSDFEYLYKTKDQWSKFLPKITPPINDFLNSINRYQFKAKWSDSELVEVIQYYENIKNIFG